MQTLVETSSASEPEFQDGALHEEAHLPSLARKALDESDINQTKAAKYLGVSRSALSMALSDRIDRGRNLCIRVIERFSEFMLDGPLFRLRRAPKSAANGKS